MSFDFFEIDEKEPPKPKKPKVEKSKEACPYCGKKFKSVSRHLPSCPENPANQVEESSKAPRTTIPDIEEKKLIKELRKQFKKTLSPEEAERFNLEPEEMKKIEEVMKFLGGTEGYQFIYKSITGDKIRGSMPYIIDQCIEWLKKHKIYILLNKN